jgi:hypothetical protein
VYCVTVSYLDLFTLFQFRYPVVARIVRQYRNLTMLLRAGVGNTPDRNLDSLTPGELALLCPACPRPDVNLPAAWESTSTETR